MSDIIQLNDCRVARGLAPIDPATAFGPPAGKRIGDRVVFMRDGAARNGWVVGWRPLPGLAPVLLIASGGVNYTLPADDVVAL